MHIYLEVSGRSYHGREKRGHLQHLDKVLELPEHVFYHVGWHLCSSLAKMGSRTSEQ